jgi:AcrR family transcriptional regulator
MEMAATRDHTAADWLQAAFPALRSGGVEAVKVEPLARSLGLTKGSFYWHFRDREALLEALLAEWERRAGERILARIEGAGRSPEERLSLLFETVIREGRGALDPAVRAWALTDERAADCLARVDALRLAWLERLFQGLGFAGEDARARARLAYLALIGEYALRASAEPAERLVEARRTLALLTGSVSS